jgi:hypothetical protein
MNPPEIREFGCWALSRRQFFAKVRFAPILLKKSKTERLRKSRRGRFLGISAAAGLYRTDRSVCGRFRVNRCGPSRRRGLGARAVLKNSVRQRKESFSTQSAAGSTDRRNTFCELLSWGLIEQGLSRPFIELPCDRAELGLARIVSRDRTKSPTTVSRKREYSRSWPETFGSLAAKNGKTGRWR